MEIMQPQEVWKHFHSLTQTPHPSGHTEKVQQLLINFAKDLNLPIYSDKSGNIIISAPATKGMENKIPVVLQAHMDMVPQKSASSKHDFINDPLNLQSKDDWLMATDTTLGADDGIGVAAAMAVLSSNNIIHGPLEVLITNDEETGMIGAFGLEPNKLRGKIMLNLDSETEGEIFIGGAGGTDADFTFPMKKEILKDDYIIYNITIGGLNGGHSGLDIQLERANANKLMGRILKNIIKKSNARTSSIYGGNMRNAIPREAKAIVAVFKENEQLFKHTFEIMEQTLKNEYKTIEPNLSLTFKKLPANTNTEFIPEMIQDDIVNAICASPDGVISHVAEEPLMIESSLNLSTIETTDSYVKIGYLVRSSMPSKKQEICSTLESIYNLAGAQCKFSGSYPGWTPNLNSPILKQSKKIYKNLFDKEPKIKVIHAGLECGIINSTYPKMDIISFGPTLLHPHSPSEKVNIPSVERFWKFLITILFEIPDM